MSRKIAMGAGKVVGSMDGGRVTSLQVSFAFNLFRNIDGPQSFLLSTHLCFFVTFWREVAVSSRTFRLVVFARCPTYFPNFRLHPFFTINSTGAGNKGSFTEE